jgi:hypothetical protein
MLAMIQDHLEERSERDAGIGASTEDVASVVEHGQVQRQRRRDTGDEGDDEQPPREPCGLLRVHVILPLPLRTVYAMAGTVLRTVYACQLEKGGTSNG